MSQTNNLIVILDQLALVATLAPGMQDGFFDLQSLRQINGTFINPDQTLNTDNLHKLLTKIDAETYSLILPDSLFFDQIFAVPATKDEEIKAYLNDDIFPQQTFNFDTHQIETSLLLQLKDSVRLQISAVDYRILNDISQAAQETDIIIESIIPLSWLTKTVIGLEPSLSLVELGDHLYLAQHYIGLSNTLTFDRQDLDQVIAKITELKAKEPNLQMAYLMTENQTEQILKKGLKDILPLQQLASNTQEDGIASTIKTYLENGLRSLNQTEFATPHYQPLDVATAAQIDLDQAETMPAVAVMMAETLEESTTTEAIEEDLTPVEPEIVPEELDDLTPVEPTPTPVANTPEDLDLVEPVAVIATETVTVTSQPLAPLDDFESIDDLGDDEPVTAEKPAPASAPVKTTVTSATVVAATPATPRPAPASVVAEPEPEMEPTPVAAPVAANRAAAQRSQAKPRVAVQKTSGLKKFLIFLLIFIITIAVGLLIGFGLLKFLDGSSTTPEPLPAPVVTPTPSPEPTPAPAASSSTAEPEPTIEFSAADYKVKVVNATAIAGLAGQTKNKLEAADYPTVATGNAVGKYDAEDGDLLLLKEANSALAADLKKASGLTLTEDKDAYATEDKAGTYDAIIVLTSND